MVMPFTSKLTIKVINEHNEEKVLCNFPHKLTPNSNKKEKTLLSELEEYEITEETIINAYIFDTVWTIKKKIEIVTKIPWYKLSLFWGNKKYSYSVKINNQQYPIDHFKITENDTYMIENKHDIIVESYDDFILLDDILTDDNINNILYVRILDNYIDDFIKVIDRMKIENKYYGFIIKYFPHFTYDLFYSYITKTDNVTINKNYPILSKYPGYNVIDENNILRSIILDDIDNNKSIYKNYINSINFSKTTNKYRYKKCVFKISNISSSSSSININTAFDVLHIGMFNIDFMSLKINKNQVYKKKRKGSTTKELKSEEVDNTLMLYIDSKKLLFSNNPIIIILYKTLEVDIIVSINQASTYDNIKDICKELTSEINSILKFINDNTIILQMDKSIKLFEYDNINWYTSKFVVDESVEYLNIHSENSFNYFKESLEKYKPILFNNIDKSGDSGLLSDTVTISTNKCINHYNIDVFHLFYSSINNTYVHYYTEEDLNKWNIIYKGTSIKLVKIHSMLIVTYSYLTFKEILLLSSLLRMVINYIERQDKSASKYKKNKEMEGIGLIGKNKLKKLKILDPTLYAFEESIESKKKYSKICQKPFHPSIYSEDDYKVLPQNIKKKAIKYKNITTDEDVYYHCANPEAPYLGFIVGEHPDNYCLPCCRVKKQDDKDQQTTCLEKYKIFKDTDTTEQKKYTLKTITKNRYSIIPLNINDFLSYVIDKNASSYFYIYGIYDIKDIISFIYGKDSKIYNDNNILKKQDYYEYIFKAYNLNILIIDKNAVLETNYYSHSNDNMILLYKTTEAIDENKLGYNYYLITRKNNNTLINRKDDNNDDDKNIFDKINGIIQKHIHKLDIDKNSVEFRLYYLLKMIDIIKIKKVYINNKKLLYAIQLEWNKKLIYIPIYYTPLTQNLSSELEKRGIVIEKYISKEDLVNIKINNIEEYLLNVCKISTVESIIVEKKGELITGIVIDNKLSVILIDPIIYSSYTVLLLKKEEKYIRYSIYDFMLTLYKINESSKIEMITSISNNELITYNYDPYIVYYKNIYKLLLQEISYYFKNKVNVKIRKRIINILLKNTNNYPSYSKSIKELYPDTIREYNDITILLNKYNEYNKHIKKTKDVLNNERFSFDDEDKNEFINNPSLKIIIELMDILCVYMSKNEIIENLNIEQSNMFLPCGMLISKITDKLKTPYCKKNKLMLPKDEINKFANLVYNDLLNPVKKLYILDKYITIDDPFFFDLNEDEELEITFE